jgi:rhodanese-related sulfurtransferase
VKRFARDLAGGLVIIAAAAAIGILHNAVRGASVPLIQDVERVSTVQRVEGENETNPAGSVEVGAPSDLPEGAVTAEQVKAMMDEGNAYVIDARAPSVYAEGHIAGAINIPYDRLPEYYDQLTSEVPTDATIICYCWSPTCDFSDQLATELKIMGYSHVVVFLGGWEHWQQAGYATEGTKTEG